MAPRLAYLLTTLLFAASHCVSRCAQPRIPGQLRRPATAFCVRSKLTSTHARIPCACQGFRNTSTRAHNRFLAQGHEVQQFRLPRTIPCACHAKRCPATPQLTRHAKRTLHTQVATPATRNTRWATSKGRCPTSCHAKRTLSNGKTNDSPHLLTGKSKAPGPRGGVIILKFQVIGPPPPHQLATNTPKMCAVRSPQGRRHLRQEPFITHSGKSMEKLKLFNHNFSNLYTFWSVMFF